MDILIFYKALINYACKLGGVHFLFVGLIPDPSEKLEYDKLGCRHRFIDASNALKDLCLERPLQATFVNAPKLLTYRGKIDRGMA